jgi:hypothetical protein
MPRKRSNEPVISIEWAESLIGLSMKVPQNWWVGCSGHKLHDGRIDSFDISEQKWNLLLDARDEDLPYLMAYDAVYEYADETSSTFHEYQLTYQAVRLGDEEIETAEGTRYTKTTSDEWEQVSTEEDGNGRTIDPIECTVDEEFSVNITDEEVKTLMDDSGEIRYEKVFRWCLPRYGDDDNEKSLFEFQAARMRNYMKKRVLEENYKPRYYTGDKEITGDHVARFYGACLGRMLTGGRSIEQIFSTREILDAVPSIQASMTKGALQDLTTCLHYSDDWDPKDDDRPWDDIYKDAKVVAEEGTASHRLKHGRLEDGYNKVCTVVCCCCCYCFESIS